MKKANNKCYCSERFISKNFVRSSAYLLNGQTQAQSGRSMVEMLGVLAIVGILSVTGVVVYTNAMNKHRANVLLEEASRRATVVAGQIILGNSPSLEGFTNRDLGYAVFGDKVNGEDGSSLWTTSDKKFALQ